jgi:DNA-binding LytR/AlgR family response regulator
MTTTMTTPPTCLIAEDEPLLAAGLQAALKRHWPELHTLAMVGDGLSAVAQTLALRPQVCFFDIRMPGCSGLEAAQALAEQWPEDEAPFPLLVFVTAYDDYALQAFEAQAVDYLVKPVQNARLGACIHRLRARLEALPPASADGASSQTQADALAAAMAQLRGLLGASQPPAPRLALIQAQVGAVVHLLPIGEVVYFEAADKYLRVLTSEREVLIRTALRELLPQLDPEQFWQIHRGTVVRASAIEAARRDEAGKLSVTLRGRPETLAVSRLYAHLFKGM